MEISKIGFDSGSLSKSKFGYIIGRQKLKTIRKNKMKISM